MRKILLTILLLCLCSCANKNIVEINIPSNQVRSLEIKLVEKEIKNESDQSSEQTKRSHQESNKGNNGEKEVIDTCSTFIYPVTTPLPPLPSEIILKKKLSNEKMLELLTNHVYELRTIMSKNKELIDTKRDEFNNKCKK